MIEITDFPKEVLNVPLIREIECVPFRISVERCDRLFNPVCVTLRDDFSRPACHNLLRHC